MRAVVVFAVLAAVALAGAPHFTSCGGGNAYITDVRVKTDTPDWKQGTTVHFTIEGTMHGEFSGGHVDTKAWFFGSEVENKRDDLCTYAGTPFRCSPPTPGGYVAWTFPFEIPALPFPGTLESHSNFVLSSGQEMMCIKLKVDL